MLDKTEEKSEKNLLSGLMNQIAGSGEDKKPSSFPVTMVLLGVMILIISFMGIKLALAKRKAIELAIQVRRVEEERRRVKENMEISDNSTERQAAWEEIRALTGEVLNLKAKIIKRRSKHQEYVKGLKSVTSWDDVIVVDGRDG